MKINRIIYEFEKWLAIILLLFLFALSFTQVVLRYFFKAGFAWVPEMVVFGFISLTLVGASTGIRSGVHIGVDVVVKLFPIKFQKLSHVFANLCGLTLYLFMSYLTYKFVMYFREMGQVSIITEIPIWIMITYMPVAFLFMAFHYLENLWENFHDSKTKEGVEFKRGLL
ncbi:MAG: TRAP transporter small permease [Deltaproteobacteria bacterium]|nr:TRAP transporter small permease [Deltaproteobacteria bacterium]MBW2309263.1 TRAP transporter small permease [Deltaproteobacteria bacterium]